MERHSYLDSDLAKNRENPQSIPEKLNELNAKKEDSIMWVNRMTYTRDRFLMRLILIPVLVMLLVFVLMFVDMIRFAVRGFLGNVLSMPDAPFSIYLFYLFVYLVACLLAALPVLSRQLNINRTRNELSEIEQEIEQLSLSLSEARLAYLRKRFFIVAGEAIKTRWIDDNRRDNSKLLQDEISDMLSDLELREKARKSAGLMPLMFDWDDVRIRLSQWSDLIKDEGDERREGRNWKLMSILISVVYLLLILISIPSFGTQPDVFGIPFRIVIWSALGSFAAILYRFYKSPIRIKFEKEFRWLIARPIIGIIMGSLSYLALVSGALIFSVTSSADLPDNLKSAGEQWQYWMVAFLGGFSDKFYEKVIEWLTSKFTAGAEDHTEDDNKESIVDEKKDNTKPHTKSAKMKKAPMA